MLFALGPVRGGDLCAHCVARFRSRKEVLVMEACFIRTDSLALTRQTTILFEASLCSIL